jgi:hypothetical protein
MHALKKKRKAAFCSSIRCLRPYTIAVAQGLIAFTPTAALLKAVFSALLKAAFKALSFKL